MISKTKILNFKFNNENQIKFYNAKLYIKMPAISFNILF